jgi:hypothetical protein
MDFALFGSGFTEKNEEWGMWNEDVLMTEGNNFAII